MALRLKRFVDDITQSWGSMPKSQELKWYGAVLRHAPTVLRERKFYSADREMQGVVYFRTFGREFSVDIRDLGSTAGNPYAFCRELFVRQIYFRAFKDLNFIVRAIRGRLCIICGRLGFRVARADDNGDPVDTRSAAYTYASKMRLA